MAEIAGYEIPTVSGVLFPWTAEQAEKDCAGALIPGIVTVSGTAISYIMRGYDTDVSHLVYWTATTIDSDASTYGGTGPVTDVVVFRVIGA